MTPHDHEHNEAPPRERGPDTPHGAGGDHADAVTPRADGGGHGRGSSVGATSDTDGTDAEQADVPDTSGGSGGDSGGVTVAGAIPGLIRKCTPVVGRHSGTRGVVVALQDDPERGPGAWVAETLGGTLQWVEMSKLDVDLTDATGRAHAAWWLAQRVKTRHGTSEETFHRIDLDPTTARVVCLPHRFGGGAARLDGFCRKCCEWGWGPTFVHQEHLLPYRNGEYAGTHEVGRLDPSDPRLLPDGSRLVDALALRAVVLHVAEEVTRG